MAEPTIEELSPSYIREKRIVLQLEPAAKPTANAPLLVNVDYSRAKPEGIVLPLILELQGPSRQSYQRREYTRSAPGALLITPREGGAHTLVLREAAHNRYWGSLNFSVDGELLEPPKIA